MRVLEVAKHLIDGLVLGFNRLFRLTKLTIFVVTASVFLALNAASLTVSSLNALFSTAISMVSGIPSVSTKADSKVARLNADLENERVKARKIAKELDVERVRSNKLSSELAESVAAKKVLTKNADEAAKAAEAVLKLARKNADELAIVTARITRRGAIAAGRNLSSLGGEAIPYVGIAVILGVTTWDLLDLCQTGKDMQEINRAFNPDALADPEVERVCGMKVPTKEEVWAQVKASPGAAWHYAQENIPDLPEMPDIDAPDWITSIPNSVRGFFDFGEEG